MKEYTGPVISGPYTAPGFTLAQILRRYNPQKVPTGGAVPVVQPFCVPWTEAADSFGVAFPAGLVGVIGNIGATGGGDYETQVNAYIAANIIPVPGVLPVGYTARLEHDCGGLIGTDMGTATTASGNANYTRYMGASGPVAYLWVPVTRAAANGTTSTITVSQFALSYFEVDPDIYAFRTIATSSVGWREIGYTWKFTGNAAQNLTETLVLTISHNADGSAPAALSEGDTIDHTYSFAPGDFTHNGSTTWTSGTISTGPIIPTLGVPSTYVVMVHSIDTHGDPGRYNGSGGAPGGVCFTGNFSPNVTVPFRWTCCGDGDLIAPGGLV